MGASVGIGSTMLVERVKWHRDREQRWHEVRRLTYVEYLTALNRAYETLWALAWGEYQADREQNAVAREILRSSEIYETRQRVLISAPSFVIDPCEVTFQRLKEVRDLLGVGTVIESGEFKRADMAFRNDLRIFITAVRRDLGAYYPKLDDVEFPLFFLPPPTG
jgi:hypothetical protein